MRKIVAGSVSAFICICLLEARENILDSNFISKIDSKGDNNILESKNNQYIKNSQNIESKLLKLADSSTKDSIKLADSNNTESPNHTKDREERGIMPSDLESLEYDKTEDGLFFHGGLEQYNKLAFATKETNTNPLPSVSYGYMLGELTAGYKYKSFEVALGMVGAGLAYDSSNGLAFNYIGYYPGWNLNQSPSADNASRLFIHNAYLKYSIENLEITAGRFAKDSDWVSAYVEGVDAIYSFSKKYHVRLFGMSTLALVGAGWLNNFATTYSSYGLINAEFGYTSEMLKAEIFGYFGASEYFAPGFDVTLFFGKRENIAYTTKINMLFPFQFSGIETLGNYFFGDFGAKTTGFTGSILLRQDVDFFDKYKVAFAIYKNINNANARMGVFGNPIGIDVWDSSAYTTGSSLNASVAPDAFSLLLFTEARLGDMAKYLRGVTIGLDGRYTTAPSANEYSLKLSAGCDIVENLSVELTLNYYTMDMKDPAAWGSITNKGRYFVDRSYFLTRIAYSF